MKLLLSVLEDSAAGRVSDALIAGGFGVTRVNTSGGFLKRGNATLLVGVEDAAVDSAMTLMQAAYTHTTGEAPASPGGPIFVVGIEQTIRM